MHPTINQFEQAIADHYGAEFGIGVDCCTHAIELCLRLGGWNKVACPKHTYLSIPMTFQKLGLCWQFQTEYWEEYYYIADTPIIDAAVYWKKDGYIPGTLMCLSFQFQKHLNLIRGGAILTDDSEHYLALKKLSFDGRYGDQPWRDQVITSMGYHYYMPIETAKLGLEKIDAAIATPPRRWSSAGMPRSVGSRSARIARQPSDTRPG